MLNPKPWCLAGLLWSCLAVFVAGQDLETKIAPSDTPANPEISTDQLIDSIISRSTALYSGLIEWEYIPRGNGEPGVAGPIGAKHFVMGIRGDDWALRYPGGENFEICRQGVKFSYAAIDDPKRKAIHRTMAIEPPQNLIDWIGMSCIGHALRGGALPWEKQVLYIDTHRGEARRLPRESIRDRECEVVEWSVKIMDYDDGLITFPMELAKAEEGRLRLYAAPSLQGALVRVEYRTTEDQVVYQRDHDEFQSVTDQIWFPMHMIDRSLVDGKWWEDEYRVKRVEHVNQKLPDYVFELKVPLGTRIRDERPGMPRVGFELKDPKQMKSLLAKLGSDGLPKPTVSWRRVLIWLNGFLLVTLMVYWRSTRCPTSH